jgi:hypothetical protein
MKHFLEYRKASYELVMLGECKANVNLPHEIEAYVVHAFAKYMEQPTLVADSINGTIAIKMLQAVNKSGELRKQELENVAQECMLIDGLKLHQSRWLSSGYYRDMGILALEHRTYSTRPPETFYIDIAKHFGLITTVLKQIKV